MFDSGIGGLTVMKEVIRLIPNEKILYFGDTARVPYGNKAPETIRRYSREAASFLVDHQTKLIVVACNSASAYAIDELKEHLSIPILGVVAPGAKKAAELTNNQRIGVLGTRATINSGAYKRAINQILPGAEVISTPCPLFVPLVEEDFVRHEAAELIVRYYLEPLLERQIDTLLLGCTHYPLLKDQLRSFVGDRVAIVDSGEACAEELCSLLKEIELETTSTVPSEHRFFVSDDQEQFIRLGEKFLGFPIHHVESVQL